MNVRKFQDGPLKKGGLNPNSRIGAINPKRQICLGHRGKEGNPKGQAQLAYMVVCLDCGYQYGCSGQQLYKRNCPKCQDGEPGIPF